MIEPRCAAVVSSSTRTTVNPLVAPAKCRRSAAPAWRGAGGCGDTGGVVVQRGVQEARPDDSGAAGRAIATLRTGGHRITDARRAVIEVLASTSDHPNAEQLCNWVSEQYPAVHRATVYRTLERLTALGVVTHVHISGGATTYHLADSDGRDHLHASCRVCGRIIDLPGDLLDPIGRRLTQDSGFDLDAAHVALSGTCHGCRDGAPASG